MSWLRKLFGGGDKPAATKARQVTSQATPHPAVLMQQVWAQHGDELQRAMTGPARQRSLALWRETIDRDAHDYADYVLAHPQRGQIVELESRVLLEAFACGHAARQGWIPDIVAQQCGFALGRMLRDNLRGAGVGLDGLSANLGTVMSLAFDRVVAFGTNAEDAAVPGAKRP